MCPVATVLDSANLANAKIIERKIICNRKIYEAMEAFFQNVTKQSQQVIP